MGVVVHQGPRPAAQVALHKLLEPDLAQEADALAVPPRLVGQARRRSQLPHLHLEAIGTTTFLAKGVGKGDGVTFVNGNPNAEIVMRQMIGKR